MSGLRRWRERGPGGRAGADALFLAASDLRVGEARRIALVLLCGDPGEDAVEMLVLDDDAGIDVGMILRVEAGRKHAAVDANGDGAVFGFADNRRRAPQPPGRGVVLEHVQ